MTAHAPRKEPASYDDFSAAHFCNRELLNTGNPLNITFPPRIEYDRMGTWFLKEAFVQIVRDKVAEHGESKVHFLVPLVGQHATLEFLRGAVKALFAEQEVAVTGLRTPKRVMLNRFYESGIKEGDESRAAENMNVAIRGALRRHGTSPASTKFVVIDFFGGGTTERAIKRGLGCEIDFIDQNQYANMRTGEFPLAKDKSRAGDILVGRGSLLELLLKDPEEGRGGTPFDFAHGGEYLFEALDKQRGRYFNEQERATIGGRNDFESDSPHSWPEIVAKIKALPEDRRTEIVRKLKADDKRVARMCYHFGMATAREVLRHGVREKPRSFW